MRYSALLQWNLSLRHQGPHLLRGVGRIMVQEGCIVCRAGKCCSQGERRLASHPAQVQAILVLRARVPLHACCICTVQPASHLSAAL